MAGLSSIADTEYILALFLGCRLAQFRFYGLPVANCQLPVVNLMSASEWVQKIKYYCGLNDKTSIQYLRSRYYRGNQFTGHIVDGSK